jgi:hypothetical protein
MATDAAVTKAQQARDTATLAHSAAEQQLATAKLSLQRLDAEVRGDITAWSVERQSAEREQRQWAVNVAQAAVTTTAARVKETTATLNAAKHRWMADPTALEEVAAEYIDEAQRINAAIAVLGRDIKALDAVNGLWQDMSTVQEPDIYGRMAKQRLVDGSDRLRQLLWVIGTVRGDGVLIPAMPHMSRATAADVLTAEVTVG